MAVIGDVVGDGADLRFRARITGEFEVVPRIVVRNRLRDAAPDCAIKWPE